MKKYNESVLKLKKEYWGDDRMFQGLTQEFRDLIKIITDLKKGDKIPYQKMIDLMLIDEDGNKISMDDICFNNLIDIQKGLYFKKAMITNRNMLQRFL